MENKATAPLKAPFPWFGAKSAIASAVWQRLGQPRNYLEPFAGSLAMLLARPDPQPGDHIETVNDADGLLANFWRALAHDPEVVAYYADWPVNEADLHARHLWLLARKPRITEALMGDPHYYDAKVAGWWVWGQSAWIGNGWCAGNGSWVSVDGELVKGNAGRGVHRQVVHLGDAGRGVHRKMVHPSDGLLSYLTALAQRLRHVRVVCGDWSRIMGDTPLRKLGTPIGVFLDPPYDEERDARSYTEDRHGIGAETRAWALENGHDLTLRIALCSYTADTPPDGWTALPWKAKGGYGNQSTGRGRANAEREVIWFSPGCINPDASNEQLTLHLVK